MRQAIPRNDGCRISDEWTYRGQRVLVMENDSLRVVILLDKGSDIITFEHKPTGIDALWKAPWGDILSPGDQITSRPRAEGNFSDYHEGGWQECFPNGGRVCEYRGAELGLHGEVFGLPWECRIVEDGRDQVAAELAVRTRRTPFLLRKTLRMERGSASLEISETVTNEGRHPMEFMWGHHPAFGEPLLSGETVVTTGARTARLHPGDDPESRFAGDVVAEPSSVPGRSGEPIDILRIPAPGDVASDMFYLTDMEEGFYALTNTRLGLGFGMEFDPEVFPCLWYWIACNAPGGAPFHGRSYTVALEPFTSWPAILTNAIANGTQRELAPGASLSTTLRAGMFQSDSPPQRSEELRFRP
jgi:galactose mutarotase-like enzyme